jgi:2-aminoethylphosphonate transport system permease protein
MSSAALTTEQPRRLLSATGLRLWVVPPALVLLGVFFYPLSLIVGQSFGSGAGPTLGNYAAVLGSSLFANALLHPVQISVTASTGCLILGFILSLVLGFVPFPGSHVIGRMIDTFIALPTFLVTLAFTFIYGSAGALNEGLMHAFNLTQPPVSFLYTQWGVVLAEVTVYTPFIIRPLLAAFSLIDPALIEVASRLGARPTRIVRQIILPAGIPALMAGGSLCLLLTVN